MSDENLISKTRRKRQAHDLQDLGEALTRLRADQLARIELPDDLREAVADCRGDDQARGHPPPDAVHRPHDARPRLPRPSPRSSRRCTRPSHRQTALFHRAETLARRASSPTPARGALRRRSIPAPTPQRLRALAAAAREERQAEQPPKRYRELFQAINAILQDHARREP